MWTYCYRRSSMVCWSITIGSPAEMAEPIQMLFGTWTWVGSRKHVFDGVPDPRTLRGNFEGGEWPAQSGHARLSICSVTHQRAALVWCGCWLGCNTCSAHWRHRANTIELCDGNVTSCQITLTTCYGRPMEWGRPLYFHPVVCSIYLSFSLFPRLISAAADWMSAILPHMVWP